jgi:acyl carrier protein
MTTTTAPAVPADVIGTIELTRRISVIVSRELHVHLDQITPEAKLHEDLAADHIDVVGLIVDIEDEFEIRLEDEASIEAVRTVADLVALAAAALPAHVEAA